MRKKMLDQLGEKWTNSPTCVHWNLEISGQTKSTQVVDLSRKDGCPSKANLRVQLEGTLPGKGQ